MKVYDRFADEYIDVMEKDPIAPPERYIELVEVVRCKECRWWSGSVNTSHNNHLCKRALNQNVEYWTRSDDYCSYGERKGGEIE